MKGLIAKKIGMTQFFLEDGSVVPVTVVKVEKNTIVNIKTKERDGYNAVVLGIEDLKESKVNKAYNGQFKENLKPKRYLKEFRLDDVSSYKVGQEIGVEVFDGINFVDVAGVTKGKGFQGVMKRHGFHGGRKTHGSKFHRQNGSTGQNTYPARVFKGLKRAGRMGADNVTVQSLRIVNKSEGLLLIKGAIPGINKGIVTINKAVKKA